MAKGDLKINVVVNKENMVVLDDDEFLEFKNWRNNRIEEKRKSDNYWLTHEGREEVREIWEGNETIWEGNETEIPIVYLNEIERLEGLLKEIEITVEETKDEIENEKIFPVS